MSDLYIELLVKKKKTGTDSLMKGLMIGGTVILVLAGLIIHPFVLALALVMGIVDYIFLPRFDVEYEYLYVNGELDIDYIYSKSKRKRAGSFDLDNTEIIAPVKSHQLDYYNNNSRIKTLDFSSREEDHKVYAMIVSKENQLLKVLFEPDEKMLREFKNKAPRKVFMD